MSRAWQAAQEDQKAKAAGTAAGVTPAEAVRRAKGAWHDASLRYEQASSHVKKCRENLERALAKEADSLRALATAEIGKIIAGKALAKELGIASGDIGNGDGQQKNGIVDITWDTEFYASLNSIDCEQSEKDVLLKFEAGLEATKTDLASKSADIAKWKERTTEMKKEIEERSAKQRKTDDAGDGGAAPAAAPQAPQAPAAVAAAATPADAAAPSEAAILAEMERIKQAKAVGEAAAEAAAQPTAVAPEGAPAGA